MLMRKKENYTEKSFLEKSLQIKTKNFSRKSLDACE